MSALPFSLSVRSVLIDRLRAAGCVFAEDEAQLLIEAASSPAELDALVERRIAGLPLEHVLGWAEFCGLRVAVDPGVFVPRQRTEFLARQAIQLTREAAVVVDLCCGSGAVGVAVMAARRQVELYAADIEPAAVQCARRNLATAGSVYQGTVYQGSVYQGDLYDPLPSRLRGRVDVLIANAPYVPTEAIGLMPPEARLYEPRVALDGGADGLDVLRRVITQARVWLAPGGHLLVETSAGQSPSAAETFRRSGFLVRIDHSAELDATVVIGTHPG